MSNSSHLGYLTAKRGSGQGWVMRGVGSQRSTSRVDRPHGVRSFWLRRRRLRHHSHRTCRRKAASAWMLVGTA